MTIALDRPQSLYHLLALKPIHWCKRCIGGQVFNDGGRFICLFCGAEHDENGELVLVQEIACCKGNAFK